MSNIIPNGNKIHSLGTNEIKWNELWIGSIDVDEKINSIIYNLDINELANIKYDSFKVRGHIRINQGDYFLKDFINNNLLLNLAEELKNIQDDIISIGVNNSPGFIQQINSIGIEHPTQYNNIDKIITLYTDNINELDNDPDVPHLWWTQSRFNNEFIKKSITNLLDYNDLLTTNNLNNGSQLHINDISRNIPIVINGKIPTIFLPDYLVEPFTIQNKTLKVGTVFEKDNYENLFEGLFWKIFDNNQPELNDYLYIYDGNQWLQLSQSINQQEIIKTINTPQILQIDNNKNLTGLNISKISEYNNPDFKTAKNIYFSRQRLFDSIISPDNSLLIVKEQNTNKTKISLLGFTPISSLKQVHESLGFSVVPNQTSDRAADLTKTNTATLIKNNGTTLSTGSYYLVNTRSINQSFVGRTWQGIDYLFSDNYWLINGLFDSIFGRLNSTLLSVNSTIPHSDTITITARSSISQGVFPDYSVCFNVVDECINDISNSIRNEILNMIIGITDF